MADTGIFATTAEVQRFTPIQSSTVSNTEAYINVYMSFAESYINNVCGWNFSDTYASLNVDVKRLLSIAACALAAIDIINYDTTGFPSIRYAELALDVLAYKFNLAIAQLKEKVVRGFINAPVSA